MTNLSLLKSREFTSYSGKRNLFFYFHKTILSNLDIKNNYFRIRKKPPLSKKIKCKEFSSFKTDCLRKNISKNVSGKGYDVFFFIEG